MEPKFITKIGGGRSVITLSYDDGTSVTQLVASDGTILQNDGPYCSSNAKQKHDEMVARNTSL